MSPSLNADLPGGHACPSHSSDQDGGELGAHGLSHPPWISTSLDLAVTFHTLVGALCGAGRPVGHFGGEIRGQ